MSNNLPCEKCRELDVSCCKNPQIVWTMVEVDELFSKYPTINDNNELVIAKAELPGTVYILRMNPQMTSTVEGIKNSIVIEYCSMYNPVENKCTVEDCKPQVCKSFGDPDYMACPFDGLNDDTLMELVRHEPDFDKLHQTAETHPEKYLQEFVLPWLKAFDDTKEEHPEYMEWWESLSSPNFNTDIDVNNRAGGIEDIEVTPSVDALKRLESM